MDKKAYEEMVRDSAEAQEEIYEDIINNKIHDDPLGHAVGLFMQDIGALIDENKDLVQKSLDEGLTKEEQQDLANSPESIELLKGRPKVRELIENSNYQDNILKIGERGSLILGLLHTYPSIKEFLKKNKKRQDDYDDWFESFKNFITGSILQTMIYRRKVELEKERSSSANGSEDRKGH